MNTRVTFFITILISFVILTPGQMIFSQNVGSAARMYINNINLPLDNNGKIADVVVPDGGTINGYYSDHEFLFSGGFFLSGFENGNLWANGVAGSFLVQDYQPGIVGMDPNDSQASLYALSSQDPAFGQSWQDWTDAVNLGADFYDGDHNGIYDPIDLNNNGVWDPTEDKPDIIGDRIYWCVYNDGVPADQRRWESEPLGIETRQTMFAFNSSSNLSDVIFLRYRIKNTGLVSDTLKDVYFCNFADADIGEVTGYSQNFTGIDTIRNADYTYLKNPSPQDWGNYPPCFMTDMLTGPLAYIPEVSFEDLNGNGIYDPGVDIAIDTAYSFRGPLGVPIYPGALNENLTSSIFYYGGDPIVGDASNPTEVRNNMLGLIRTGVVADPCNWLYGQVQGGIQCDEVDPYYWSSGEPVTNVGWISSIPGDVRNIQSAGPFKLVKNKEIEILAALIVGQGNSPLNSITVTGNISDEIQNYYENNFGYPYVLSIKDKNIKELNFSLYQNYPNPFNPITKINYTLPKREYVRLSVYDILGNEVKVLKEEEQDSGSHIISFDAGNLSSGVYFYRILAGQFSETKKMIILK